MELSVSKYYQWRDGYGKANEHNVLIPRDHWLEQTGTQGPLCNKTVGIIGFPVMALESGSEILKVDGVGRVRNRRRNARRGLRSMTVAG